MLNTNLINNNEELYSDGVALINKQGKYYYLNEPYTLFLGHERPDEILGKPWTTTFSPEYAEQLQNNILPLVLEKGSWTGEAILLTKEEKTIRKHISLTKIPDDNLICICQQHPFQLNSSRIAYLMDNLGKGILLEDENRTIIFVNKQFCTIFNIVVEPENLIGADFIKRISDSSYLFKQAEQGLHFYQKLGEKDSILGDEVYFSDGRLLSRDYVPIYINGSFKGQLWSCADITQTRQLQMSLVEARNRAMESEKAKSGFLSNMSHEIRTPMNAILGLSEQLSFTPLSEQQVFFVKNITDSAKNLLGIINDILDLSKIEAGKMTIEKEVINLEHIKLSVENILNPKAKEKGIQMITEYDPIINAHLYSDEVRIRQILINIIGNAITYTDKGYVKLTIKLKSTDEHKQVVQFICEDSGIGISEDSIKHIFEEFYQEHNSKSHHKKTGTGLGLAITKRIVNLLGGEINIESIKGLGTKVIVSIPFEQVATEALLTQKSTYDDCTLIQGKHILLVEDNELNRFVFKMMLTNLEVIVDEAGNGEEALTKIEDAKYDLILMDIQMPVMDGTEALVAIKKKYGDTIPVIALTASAFKSEVNHILNLGFSDCITKPIDQKTLQHRLCDFFDHGSVKDKYYNSIHKRIVSSIFEMAGKDPAQFSRMLEYLLEEIEYALVGWKESLVSKDWVRAKRIVHREKVMIKSIGINGYDALMKEIEDDSIVKTEAELQLLYAQLVELFENLKIKFTGFEG